jgi:hypothetical protein
MTYVSSGGLAKLILSALKNNYRAPRVHIYYMLHDKIMPVQLQLNFLTAFDAMQNFQLQ